MSGGHFDYNQHRITDIADEVQSLVESNDSNEPNEWGGFKGNHYSEETVKRFKQAVVVLRMAHCMAQRIDWLVSGDGGEETFHKRLNEELAHILSETGISIDDIKVQ